MSTNSHRLSPVYLSLSIFFCTATATTEIYTLSLHDALPICGIFLRGTVATRRKLRTNDLRRRARAEGLTADDTRSEEHTSELQSRRDLVCRLLLEKKKRQKIMKKQITYVDEIRHCAIERRSR